MVINGPLLREKALELTNELDIEGLQTSALVFLNVFLH